MNMRPALAAGIVTRRELVNRWECDENDHWNIQFYVRAFEQASEIAAIKSGAGQVPAGRRRMIHVRYHREMMESQGVVTRTARIGDGPFAGAIVHVISDAETGATSATALETPVPFAAGGSIYPGLPEVSAASVADAMPRGAPAGPDAAIDGDAMLRSGVAVESHCGIVRVHETGMHREILAAAVVSRFSDGAMHVWNHAGVLPQWLRDNGHGRVAVEMKIGMLEAAREGDPLRLVSWAFDPQGKTFSLRHQMENMATGQIVATGFVRCLVLNHQSRRAVPLPDFVVRALRERRT